MLRKSKNRIGPYSVGKKLGQGSFSVVKLAQNVDTGEKVAIKELDKLELSKAHAEQSVMDEIAIMARVQHPNIVNLKEVLTSRDKIYLIMESVTGGNLFDRIVNSGPIKEAEARLIFSQLLEGVEFCHMNGVYHRDIKASNALITSDGSIKLADFGLGSISPAFASEGNSEALLTQFCGTANCAAPEVLAGIDYKGAPADIWSLGVLLYFLTAGRPTFSDTSFSGLRYTINRARYHVPLWLSPSLVSFLRRMICPDPEQRASISELRSHAWLHGQNSEKGPEEIFDTEPINIPQLQISHSQLEDSPTKSVTSPRQPHESMNAFELMAKALDISSMLDKSPESSLKKCHFSSRALPTTIWQNLHDVILKQFGSLQLENPWRGRMIALKDSARPVSLDIEISTIHEQLLLVSFLRRSGSQNQFYELFRSIVGSPLCVNIIEGASVPSEIEPDLSPLQSPQSSPPMSRNLPTSLPKTSRISC